MLEDSFGKKLSAKTVFGLSIRYLKDDLLTKLKSRPTGNVDYDIRWVLTVPAIWSDAAKQFMREAATASQVRYQGLRHLERCVVSQICRVSLFLNWYI